MQVILAVPKFDRSPLHQQTVCVVIDARNKIYEIGTKNGFSGDEINSVADGSSNPENSILPNENIFKVSKFRG